ncbi:peptidoglycan-binding protein [Tumebacillus algifaecis]|uniref:Peptidoglycan-binding protein n=1 Tax=Tumebacillus algifaecis TaxID=1214604 RepID=A0A223D282_9BACL|nr:LysM peptidoglycan-binding domain-containing protein [Tumebacillus algifaecis]ASS75494.1 peptidoglycan-binding protein [Tumebacillus algifaecis]
MTTKAVIEVLNGGKKGTQIKVLFNPNNYSLDHSNQFAWHTVPGLSMPIAQFVSGQTPSLSMELFLDCYGEDANADVRNYTRQIAGLLDVDKDLHAPPLVKFVWGSLKFQGIIEKLTQKFTMFSNKGNPVRATLNVTFKAVQGIKEQFQEIPRQSADRTKQKLLRQGDALWMIANDEYEDPSKWREIANANGIDNPKKLEAGRTLTIPRLE